MLSALLLTIGALAQVQAFPGPDHAFQQGEITQRSPCPALNTLANHGFIRRDGTNISVEGAVSAFHDIFSADKELLNDIFDHFRNLGLPMMHVPVHQDNSSSSSSASTEEVFNLIDLYKNNDNDNGTIAFDHDASLFRQDPYHEPLPQFDQTLFDQLQALAQDGYVTRAAVGKHLQNRVIASKKNNPEAFFNQVLGFQMAGEATALFWFGNESNPDMEFHRLAVSDMHSFVAHNRFPEEWRPRSDRGLPPIDTIEYPPLKDTNNFFQNELLQGAQTTSTKYEQACVGTLIASGFDLLRTDLYDQWFDQDSTLILAQTGEYKGIDGIAEYAQFVKADFFDYYFAPVPSNEVYPVSYKDGECEILSVFNNRLQSNQAVVGQESCVEFIVAQKLKFTIKEKFYVQKVDLFYSGSFASMLFGNVLDTAPTADYVCSVLMAPLCNNTAEFNGLDSHEQCRAEYDKLPSTNDLGYLDDRSKGCRILHSSFAAKNEKHCPHLSFLPKEDRDGKIKCQVSQETLPSDLFSYDQLTYIDAIRAQFGLPEEDQYLMCDSVPALARDVVVEAKPKVKPSHKDPHLGQGLRFHTFDPVIPCADGSPAGIYIEENPKASKSRNHVISVMGGAACTSIEDCNNFYSFEPFKFSSNMFPPTIKGENILSRDHTENQLHNFTKWMIPYCSQDYFLGDFKKGKVGNFTHAGSAIFDAAIKLWEASVKANNSLADAEGYHLDTVVVAGVSSASIGVMNHIGRIRDAVNNAKTRRLKLIIDSPGLSHLPYEGRNQKQMMRTYVDFSEHELCKPLNDANRLYEVSSALPCCLSMNCMLRHDPHLSSYFLPRNATDIAGTTEEILILDSAYDFVALLPSTGLLSGFEENGIKQGTNNGAGSPGDGAAWGLVELAGTKKMRALETASVLKVPLQQEQRKRFVDPPQVPRVKWVMTNCFVHAFLATSIEFLHQGCQYGDYTNLFFSYECVEKGNALRYKYDDMVIRLLQTTDAWDLAELQGETIHKIVDDFVLERKSVSPSPLEGVLPTILNRQEVIDLRFESCQGPNCQTEEEANARRCPSCQSFLEIESFFSPIPVAIQVIWSLLLIVFLLFWVFVRGSEACWIPWTTTGDQPVSVSPTSSFSNCLVRGLSATTNDGKALLHDVDLSLKSGTVTALCGQSGSGKTMLLRALRHQRIPGISVSMEEGRAQLKSLRAAFLRQQDDSEGFGKLTPADYLRFTANILGARPEKLLEVYSLCKFWLGPRNEESSGQDDFHPFLETTIRKLSGGQRRILNLAATLLFEPDIILLDEPLSGLDSVSSIEVMSALEATALEANCSVFVSIHQPSEAIMSSFDRLVVLGAGRVVYNEDITMRAEHATALLPQLIGLQKTQGTRNGSQAESPQEQGRPDEVQLEDHSMLEAGIADTHTGTRATEESTSSDGLSASSSAVPPPATMSGSSTSRLAGPEDDISTGCPTKFLAALRQTGPIARRLHPQYGWDLIGGCVACLVINLFVALLRYEDSAVRQTVLASMAIVVIPSIMFPHKIVEHSFMWKAHQRELDDDCISKLAFQVATMSYTFLVPISSVLCSQLILYAILNWSYDTFLSQLLFSSIQVLVSLQFGRALMVWFGGAFSKAIRVYTAYLLFAFTFNGIMIQTGSLPWGLRWLFFLSINFWGLGGSIMLHFDPDTIYSNLDSCTDMITCLQSDGNAVVARLGFAPMIDSLLAISVLVGILAFLFAFEYIGLQFQSQGICISRARTKPSEE